MNQELVTESIEAAAKKLGSQAALAKLLNVTRGAVTQWKSSVVPAKHCPVIERHTGIPCENLNPNIDWSVTRRPIKEAADA